ncbi:uncharacterized protein LOC116185287 [Apis dorsata]|uniref:uncharacterized protein LOC116185287 n=1 Tax=Apis dorsata TaxID=7462 RepID=UPI00129401BD|nr:uncharacterized protein LOC116185287 [Apis dorsata]
MTKLGFSIPRVHSGSTTFRRRKHSCSLHQHHPRHSTSFSNIFFSSSSQSTFEPCRAFKRHVFAPNRLGEEARRRVLLLPFVRGKLCTPAAKTHSRVIFLPG